MNIAINIVFSFRFKQRNLDRTDDIQNLRVEKAASYGSQCLKPPAALIWMKMNIQKTNHYLQPQKYHLKTHEPNVLTHVLPLFL